MKINTETTTEACTTDFYYDLFLGGYIDPEKYLENYNDAQKVNDAIATIKEFRESCVAQIEDFEG